MCTGSGKSKVAIDMANKIIKENPEATILLVVPTQKLRDENWHEEFIKWDSEKVYNKLSRKCYVSINKIKDEHFDFVILDECHNITENSCEFFKNNSTKAIMGLSATPPEDEEKINLLKSIGLEIIFVFTLEDGVNSGIITPFKIKVIDIPLDGVSKNVEAGTKAKKFMTTEQQYYKYLDKTFWRMVYAGKDPSWIVLKRTQFIYKLKSKVEFTKKLLKTFDKDERLLIFCGSIEAAENLSKYTFHSKTTDKDLTLFKKKKINRLASVKALNEGQNIEEVDHAVIQQATSKQKDLIQRIGRIVRWREDHEAVVYIICARDTQDEVWVQNALKNIDPSYIEYENYKKYL